MLYKQFSSLEINIAAASTLLLFLPMTLAADLHMSRSPATQNVLDRAVAETVAEFAARKLKPDELAVTLVDLRDSAHPAIASHRGDVRIYPASVIKLFYLEAAHHWMEEGSIQDSAELRRAMRDMIVESYNEATHYIVDLLTGTTSGPELPPEQMAAWEHKRNVINRYFATRGYKNVNANQKPWCEGPYGRERLFVGEKYTNRNALSTDDTARLLTGIVLGKAVSQKRSAEMLALLERNPFGDTGKPDDQAHGFTGPALPPGGKLWSKAGWTSQTRHDAACIELPNGAKFVLVTFTVNHSTERGIISALAKRVVTEMEKQL